MIKSNILRIRDQANTETIAEFNENSDVKLYNNNNLKLATTSTGIDVTGDVTCDGNAGIGTSSPSAPKFSSTPDGVLNLSGNKPVVYLTEEDETDSNVWMGLSNEIGIIGNTGDGIAFRTGASTATERMRIDSSGRVGIGTSSPSQKLHISNSGFAYMRTTSTAYGGTGFDIGQHTGGSIYLNNRDNTPIIFQTNNAQRMRIDASGNLLVGTTLGDVGLWYNRKGVVAKENGQLHAAVYGGAAAVLNRNTNDGDIVQFRKAGSTVGSIGTDTSGNLQTLSSTGNYRFGDSNTTRWSVDATRMYPMSDATYDIGLSSNRVRNLYLSGVVTLGGASYDSTKTLKAATVGTTSSHYVFEGTGTQTGADGRIHYWDLANTNNSSAFFVYAQNSSGNCFNIRGDGDVENSNNSYGAISDEKLKENIAEASSQWDDLKAVQVRKYSFKSDNLDSPNQLGVIAQELEASGMGGLVKESPDVDMRTGEDLGTTTKTVKYSVLYMKAVKALQEAMDRIETLEAKVAQLEE